MAQTSRGHVEASGFRLQYVTRGNGTPVLIPGCVLYDDRTFSKELDAFLQLNFLDHRGFVVPPDGAVDTASFELDTLLQDIERGREKLGLKDFFIMGHSGHGFLALEYAKRYPNYVKGVVLVAAAPDNSDTRRNASMKAFEETADETRKQLFERNMSRLPAKLVTDPANRFMHFLLAAGPQSWYDAGFDATHLWQNVVTNMQAIDHIWGVVFRDIDITKGLDGLDKPVLLVLGQYDYLTGPPALWNEILSRFPSISRIILDKSAHTPQYEQPSEFNRHLLQWINTYR